MTRGSSDFDISGDGNLLNTAGNVEALRQLWLDRDLIEGYYLGPGDKGDFDNGAWHVACHLAGAGGAIRTVKKTIAWLEISHDATRDEYFGSATHRDGREARTVRLDAADGRALLAGGTLLGFVEGNSTGRISARGVQDASSLFNAWRRQDFDQPAEADADGGKVWEHWCTLRDIRTTARIGSSVLIAFMSLVAALGDRFVPTVARGRREYGHPDQLGALVSSGFTSRESALWKTKPLPIPAAAERLFLQADPVQALTAAESLQWGPQPRYHMFKRRIDGWSDAASVESDLGEE